MLCFIDCPGKTMKNVVIDKFYFVLLQNNFKEHTREKNAILLANCYLSYIAECSFCLEMQPYSDFFNLLSVSRKDKLKTYSAVKRS